MRARQENLRAALLAPHVIDIGAGAVARPEHFARDHLVAANNPSPRPKSMMTLPYSTRFTTPLTISPMRSLYSSILPIALGLAHFLHNDLLGRLRRDAPEIERRQRLGDPVAGLRGGIAFAGVLDGDLGGVVVDLVDDEQQARETHFASARIDLGPHLGLLPVTGAGRLLQGVLHRGDDDRSINRFLAGDRIGNLQNFKSVGADGHEFTLPRSGWREAWFAPDLS